MSRNNYIFDYDESNLIGVGKYASVYKSGDTAVKVFDQVDFRSETIDENLFNELKEIELNGFIKLYDYSIEMCSSDSKHKSPYAKKKRIVSSYTSKYYKPSKEMMIDKPMEYTINSLYELKKVYEELNNRGIEIVDAHQENVIITEDNLVIIDPDRFYFSNYPNYINEKRIIEYIISLWKEEYKNSSEDDLLFLSDAVRQYFNQYDGIDDCITQMDSKRLYKTPRTLISDQLKKYGL